MSATDADAALSEALKRIRRVKAMTDDRHSAMPSELAEATNMAGLSITAALALQVQALREELTG